MVAENFQDTTTPAAPSAQQFPGPLPEAEEATLAFDKIAWPSAPRGHSGRAEGSGRRRSAGRARGSPAQRPEPESFEPLTACSRTVLPATSFAAKKKLSWEKLLFSPKREKKPRERKHAEEQKS
ncbi:unnamed protein product [Symbiodinium microadriaticum]|nr:unnamed protein product [Symbiodinium microadriaticum]CAE7332959.1 unnamed protein product [Symbiodinium sp. KB8]